MADGGHGGLGLRDASGRQADASILNFLAVGRQRFGAIVVLISRGPSCDPQARDSPATRDGWLKVYFFDSKTNPNEHATRPSLGVVRLGRFEVHQ